MLCVSTQHFRNLIPCLWQSKHMQSYVQDWIDETKVTAAERAWNTSCCALRTAAQEVVQSCTSSLNDFRALPDRQSYSAEMGLVLRRSQWVEAFLGQGKNGQTLAMLIQEQKSGAQTAPESDATPAALPDGKTTTADFGAVSRAAPCACWQQLESLSELLALDFKRCRSQSDIKRRKDELQQKRMFANDLLAAARGAVNDMITAKKRADQAQKRQEEKARKDAEKRGNADEPAKRRKKKTGKHALINAEDESSFQSFPRFSPLGFDVRRPFIYRPGPSRMEGFRESAAKGLADFREVFKSSNLRVTEGKATRVASREVADAFVKEVQTALSGTIAIGYLAEKDGAGPAPGSGSQDAGDRDRAAAGMVEKVMKPQWFGMVPDHMSLGRYEAGLLPMIKWVVQGTFLCSVVTCDELTTDKRTGDLQAKVTSKTDGVAKENFFMGTLGPGDFLYVPAGALTSVQANRGSSPGLEFEV